MTPRPPALSLGIALLFGLAATTPAQERDELPRPDAKAKAKAKSGDATTAKDKPKLQHATFGGGCFWCLEAVYERVPGVKNVVSGYAGGSGPRPSYEMVKTGLTGHAEVVQITFDPEVISFDELLDLFWMSHDPTTLNRQGPDVGTQYRSIILYHDEDQRETALRSHDALVASGAFAQPIVTQLVPLRRFYPAEKYHQDYFRKHPQAPYCQEEIVPKLIKLEQKIRAMQAKAAEKKTSGGDPEKERKGAAGR